MGKENKKNKIKNIRPIWDPVKKEGTYPFSIPPIELMRGSKMPESQNPDPSKQDLAAKYGTDLAASIIDIYRKNQEQNGDKFVKSNLKNENGFT